MGYGVMLRDATFAIDKRKLARWARDQGYESFERCVELAADDSGWHFRFDREGNVKDIDYGRQNIGGDTVAMLERLGSIVKAGSVVLLEGEDGATMEFAFDGKRCRRSLTWGEDDGDEEEDEDEDEDEDEEEEEEEEEEDHPYWGEPVAGSRRRS